MAFALTSFAADAHRFTGPGPYRAEEFYVFTITGTSADIDLDIGDFTGTFWTAALANATYGSLATTAKTFLTQMEGQVQAVSNLFCQELAGSPVGATASGTTYTLSFDSTTHLPIYGFDTSQGLTAYTIVVKSLLKANLLPQTIACGVSI